MAKPKTKDGESVLVYIENKKLLEIDARAIGMSMSSFVDWLILNYHQSANPFEELKKIDAKENELKKERELVMKKVEHKTEFNKLLEVKKKQAKENLTRMFIEGKDIFAIQDTARFWQSRLNIPAEQLIAEVMLNLKLNKKLNKQEIK